MSVSRQSLIIGAVVATITMARSAWVTEHRIRLAHQGRDEDWTKHPTFLAFGEAIEAANARKPIPDVEQLQGSLALLQQSMRVSHEEWEELVTVQENKRG